MHVERVFVLLSSNLFSLYLTHSLDLFVDKTDWYFTGYRIDEKMNSVLIVSLL